MILYQVILTKIAKDASVIGNQNVSSFYLNYDSFQIPGINNTFW